jgi:hypothetical protein
MITQKQKTSQTQQRKLGRDKLHQIIEMMKGIQDHTVDPFLLNVDEIILIVQEYFPQWDQPEDLNLDSEAISQLASVIKLQSEWVKQRSTSLYTDPFLLEEKISQKTKTEMAEIFLKTWHPIVEQEQITPLSLANAVQYWKNLPPLKDRWQNYNVEQTQTGTTSKEELVSQNILRDETFASELERFWQELKTKIKENPESKLFYMDWVNAQTYEQTVHRAYITSFLITYGYATLDINVLEEEIFIKPLEEPKNTLNIQAISIPITLTFESWQKWNRGERE